MKRTFRRREFKNFRLVRCLFAYCRIGPSCKKEETEEEHLPLIVLIFIDDLGYADVRCYGSKGYETPNIDKLAEQGMRFTSFSIALAGSIFLS